MQKLQAIESLSPSSISSGLPSSVPSSCSAIPSTTPLSGSSETPTDIPSDEGMFVVPCFPGDA
jgi:hypothetical protein